MTYIDALLIKRYILESCAWPQKLMLKTTSVELITTKCVQVTQLKLQQNLL